MSQEQLPAAGRRLVELPRSRDRAAGRAAAAEPPFADLVFCEQAIDLSTRRQARASSRQGWWSGCEHQAIGLRWRDASARVMLDAMVIYFCCALGCAPRLSDGEVELVE